MTTDGRKIGLDQRLMNPMLPDNPTSKVNLCGDNVFRIWQETSEKRLTQLVFCDIATPNKDGRFNVYDDLRGKLIAKGVPESEIAFIHDADSEARKKALFAKVRRGQVRVLFGSTAKLGAGTNVQDRLVATHDLDCPWRPADLEQRAGRIVRQGNGNDDVHIYRYVTEQTFDSYLWQTVENKQKFIAQIMTSKTPVRSCEDVDETALSYAEIKALCSGNPKIKEKMDLDIEVARLRLLKGDFQSQHYDLEDKLLKFYPQSIEKAKAQIAGFHDDAEVLAAHPLGESGFAPMEISGVVYEEKEAAGKALLEAFKTVTGNDPVEIGKYRGLTISLSFDSFAKKFNATLKGSMSHITELSRDTLGNITRINNALNALPDRLKSVEVHLESLHDQVENARQELETPFAYGDELADKEARLAELDAELTGSKPRPAQEAPEAPEAASAKAMRPSILEALNRLEAAPVGGGRTVKDREPQPVL